MSIRAILFATCLAVSASVAFGQGLPLPGQPAPTPPFCRNLRLTRNARVRVWARA